MKTSNVLAAMVSALCVAASHGYAQSSPASIETQKSAAGVTAVDDHWSSAETDGDTAYINRMLLPEYRSVNPNGTSHPKAAIIAGAAKNIAGHAAAVAAVAEYRKNHPHGTTVVLQGNTAILTFYSTVLGPEKGIMSSDIFVYVDGRWRGLYSQHSSAQ